MKSCMNNVKNTITGAERSYSSFDEWFSDHFDRNGDFNEIVGVYRTLSGDSGYGYTLSTDSGTCCLTSDYQLVAPLNVPESELPTICQKLDELYGWPIDAEESFRHAMEKDD